MPAQAPEAPSTAPEQPSGKEVVAWAFQLIASVSWIVCVAIYDSWETGDAVQMLAASAWTASNLLSLPRKKQQQQYAQEWLAWTGQMCASVAWIVCMVIYDSWEVGDVFQVIAASAWTASNLLSLPRKQQEGGQADVAAAAASAVPADQVASAVEAGAGLGGVAEATSAGESGRKQLLAWAGQFWASTAWIISVLEYDSWETGDAFQMLAACAWTASNFLSMPE